MNAVIVTIGDEILMGQIVDSNSAYIASKLTDMGMEVVEILSVADERSAIESAVRRAMELGDLAIFTGGLGPTSDDRTKEVLADYFGMELRYSEEAATWLKEVLVNKDLKANKLNASQAIQPDGALLLKNEKGTACGICFERDGKLLFSLPGVPFEMEHLMERRVLPILIERYPALRLDYRVLKVYGITESELALRLEEFEKLLPPNIGLAYLPSPGVVKLRLTAHGDAITLLESVATSLESYLTGLKYYRGADRSPALELGNRLRALHATLATAESCTGGGIAAAITAIPGASEYFRGGVVAYDEDIKSGVLGVPKQLIKERGVVSREVAEAMAEGARRVLGTDFAVSTTGVAGPSGGTPESPVGTIWIAVASRKETIAQCFRFSNNRERNIAKGVAAALTMLLEFIH